MLLEIFKKGRWDWNEMGLMSFWYMLMGDDINTIKENKETAIDISYVVGLQVNTEYIKYKMSHYQNTSKILA